MKKQEIHTKSLDLLDEFLSSISKEELNHLINKHEQSVIKGPTYSEYLDSLFEDDFYDIDCQTDFISDELNYSEYLTEPYFIDRRGFNSMFKSPPPTANNNYNNKDSAKKFAESFFFIKIAS